MRIMNVRTRRVGEIPLVALSGELDISTAPEVNRELTKLERQDPATVVVDLRELTFIDSTGLRTILSADARFRQQGKRLVIVPGPPAVHRVFTISLLDQRLQFVDEPEALGDGENAEPS
jgi:anti-sigma B factor antagonist